MKTARSLAALVGVLAVLLLGSMPAGAHGGGGQAEITSITRSGDDITVTVRLTYIEDGHGVPDATVALSVNEGTPVPMEPGDEEGDYHATVPAEPGARIRIASVGPATAAEGTAPPAGDTPTTTSADEPTTDAEPSTTAAETATTAGSDEEAAATTPTPVPGEDGDSDDGGASPVVIGAIVAVVLAVIVAAAILLTRKPKTGDGAAP